MWKVHTTSDFKIKTELTRNASEYYERTVSPQSPHRGQLMSDILNNSSTGNSIMTFMGMCIQCLSI